MKPKAVLRSTLVVLTLAAVPLAHAGNKYFTDAGGPPSWDTTTANWGTVAGGPYGTTWASYDLANFEGTGGTVNLGTGILANTLSFNVDGYTVTGGTLGMGDPSIVNFTVATGCTGTIASTISQPYATGIHKGGPGTLVLSGSGSITQGLAIDTGTVTLAGGSLSCFPGAYKFSPGSGSGTNTAVLNQTGGSLSVTGGTIIDIADNASSTVTLNLSGGTFTSNVDFAMGVRGTSTINVSGSHVLTVPSVTYGYAGIAFSLVNFNLNGGTVVTGVVQNNISSGSSVFMFNGGTLQPSASTATFMQGLPKAIVSTGGAIVNTNGFTDTIGQALLHDSALGATADGGLTKLGNGTLTLSNTETYTGNTTVSAGTLSLGVTGTLASPTITTTAGTAIFDVSLVTGGYHLLTGKTAQGIGTVKGPMTVDSGATLTVAGATGTTTGTLNTTGNVTLNGTTVLRISKTGGIPASDGITGFASLTYGGTLSVSDITSDATALAPGDTFTLFPKGSGAYAGTFATLSLPGLPASYIWDTGNLTANGTITVATAPTVAAPSFTPAPGGYVGAINVTIGSATSGATIYYTTDGSTPTTSSAVYSSPISVPVNTAVTIKAYATSSGYADSGVVSGFFGTVSTPTWVNAAGGSWPTAANWLNTTIAAGSDSTADFSTLTLTGNPTVTLDGPRTIGNLLFDDQNSTKHAWTLNAGSGDPLTLAVSSGAPVISNNVATTINAILAGSQGLTKSGTGTLTLGGVNTYTGLTTVNAGVLSLTSAGTVSINSSGVTGAGSLQCSANTIVFNGNVTTGGNQSYTAIGSGLSQGGNISASNVVLTATGGASITLSGDYGKQGGIGNNLTLDTSSGNGTINLDCSFGRFNSWYNLTSFSANAGTGAVNWTGTYAANNSSTPITLTGAINIATNLPNSAAVTLNATAPGSVSGVLSGSMSLVKGGSSNLTLSATNTYTGTTKVNGGTLAINGSTASGSVATIGGATATGTPTLTGTGTVAGTLTIATDGGGAAGTVNPGTVGGIGTLHTGATMLFGTYVCDINDTTSDLLASSGALTLSGATLTFNALATPTASSYTIATCTGTPGSFDTVNNLPTGYTLKYNVGSIQLVKNGFGPWAASKGLDGSPGHENGPMDDPNNNGIPNVLEYVLNGDPLNSEASTQILPTLDVSGSNFVFTFTRRVESADDITQVFEYGTDLSGWTDLNITAPTNAAVTLGTPTGGTPNLQTVTVTVAKGANTTMFGRLKASQP